MTDQTTRTRRRRPARRRRLRRWLWAILTLLVLAGGTAAAIPLLSGQTEPPTYSKTAADQAIAAARDSGAERWAPPEFMSAESAYTASIQEYGRQLPRFRLFRDYTTARVAFRMAEERALQAVAVAEQNREQARQAAEQAITEARDHGEICEAFAEAMHLSRSARSLLQQARLAFSEAELLYDSGEYPSAAECAATASTLAERVTNDAASDAARFTDSRLIRTWKGMVEDTIAWSRNTGRAAVVVIKEQHALTLYRAGKPVRVYRADMGYRSVKDKLFAGDGATPEGRYRITAKKGLGNSQYHRALLLDYPNGEDRAHFEELRRKGQISRRTYPGGLIEIHGEGGRGKDWTKGCVAISNPDIDDLFGRVDIGTPVTIVGTDGSGNGKFTELVRRRMNQANSGAL